MDIIEGDSGRGLRVHGRLVESAGFVMMGVLAGIAAKLADESGIGWLGDLGTYPAVWVLALALIARVAPSAGAAAVRAGVFFAAMVGGYHAWAVLALGFPKGPELVAWLAVATLAVPLVGAALWRAMRSNRAGAGLALATTAALAVVNGATLRAVLALTGHLPLELVRPVQVVAEIAVTILLIVVFSRHRRARWWAIGAWLPLAWLTLRMVDQVLGRIGIG